MVGANPLVSHGSVAQRSPGQGPAARDHGPRRADRRRRPPPIRGPPGAFEHLPVHPDSDAWLLCLDARGDLRGRSSRTRWRSERQLERRRGAARPLRRASRRSRPSRMTGVPANQVRELARDLAGAERAAVYGRTGSCLGRRGTAGRLPARRAQRRDRQSRPRGWRDVRRPADPFPSRVVEMVGLGTYGKVRSRVGDLPEVLGSLPASVMAKEMTTPGAGQIRAMFFSAGNPVLSVPQRRGASEAAISRPRALARRASTSTSPTSSRPLRASVLPATTMYEREDFPLPFLSLFTTPFIQMSEAVVEPRGEARQEWEGDRGDRPRGSASCPRAPGRCASSAGWGAQGHARRNGWSTCCCAPGRRVTSSACAAAGSASPS